MMYAVWIGDHYPNLPQPLPIKSSRGTIFINIFRHGTHCIPSGERYPGTDDISEKLWDDLRKGMSREGDNGKEEVHIEFLLAILLAKMEASWANYALGEIMSHDVLALNLSFDDYFDVPMSVPSWFPDGRELGNIQMVSTWSVFIIFIRLVHTTWMQTNHYVQHTIAFPSGISGPDVRTSPLLGCMKWD